MKTQIRQQSASSQAFSRKKLYDPNPLTSLRINPVKYMVDSKRYSWLELACADVLIEKANEKGFVSYTHDGVAIEVGCSQDTVQATENKMREDGLFIFQRNYRMPTLGRLSSYLKGRSVKRRLRTFLPALSSAYAPYKIPQSVITDNDKFLFATSLLININNSDVLDSLYLYKELPIAYARQIPCLVKIFNLGARSSGQSSYALGGTPLVATKDRPPSQLTGAEEQNNNLCKKERRDLWIQEPCSSVNIKPVSATESLEATIKNERSSVVGSSSTMQNKHLEKRRESMNAPRPPVNYPIGFNCPCKYRRQFNPSYVCFGTRCNVVESPDV